MKESFVLSVVFAVQMTIFMTQPAHAAGVDGFSEIKASGARNSEVQALVEYEEQMAYRSAELEAIAILLQADQIAQAKASNSKNSKNAVHNLKSATSVNSLNTVASKNSVTSDEIGKIKILKNTGTKSITATQKATKSDSSSAF